MLSASQWTSTKSTSICGGPTGAVGETGATGPTQTLFNDGISGLDGLVGSGENPGNGGGGGVIGLTNTGLQGIGFTGDSGIQGIATQGISGITNRGIDGISRVGLQRTGATGPIGRPSPGLQGNVGPNGYPAVNVIEYVENGGQLLNIGVSSSDVYSIYIITYSDVIAGGVITVNFNISPTTFPNNNFCSFLLFSNFFNKRKISQIKRRYFN